MLANDKNALVFVAMTFICGIIILLVCILWSVPPTSYLGVGYLLAAILFLIGFFLMFFMRDPNRKIGEGIISPADGKVIIIDKVGKHRRIAVFMNPLNVHVNRVPVAGEVIETDHHPGGFKPAYDKESESNERYTTVLDTDIGEVKVVQIAGVAVRRIIPYLEKGDKVKKGDRLGHIMFGSRVDTYLPKNVDVKVELEQKVLAGITTLAEAKSKGKKGKRK